MNPVLPRLRKLVGVLEQLGNSELLRFLGALPSLLIFTNSGLERRNLFLCASHELAERISGIEILAAVRADWRRSSKRKRFPHREYNRALAFQTRQLQRLIERIALLLRHSEREHTNKTRRAARAA